MQSPCLLVVHADDAACATMAPAEPTDIPVPSTDGEDSFGPDSGSHFYNPDDDSMAEYRRNTSDEDSMGDGNGSYGEGLSIAAGHRDPAPPS